MVSVWYKVTLNESNGGGWRVTRVGGAWIVWDPRKTSTFTQTRTEIHRLWAGNIHHYNVDSSRIPVAMWGGQAAERSKQKLAGSCIPRRWWARGRGSERRSVPDVLISAPEMDWLWATNRREEGLKENPRLFSLRSRACTTTLTY